MDINKFKISEIIKVLENIQIRSETLNSIASILNSEQRYNRDKQESMFNPLYLPPELKIPDGMAYSWGTWSVKGESHPENIQRLYLKGYITVPKERHPELYSDGEFEGLISRKGSVLMQINKERQAFPQKDTNEIISEMLNKSNCRLTDKEGWTKIADHKRSGTFWN